LTDNIAKLYVSQIPRIAANAIRGELSPDQIKELLLFFCENETVPEGLLSYLRMGIKKHLAEDVSLEFALGLKGGIGRPKVSLEIGKKLALHVLEKRVDGLSYEKAVAETGSDWSKSETLIKDAWSCHADGIKDFFVAVKQLNEEPLSTTQHELLAKIYENRKVK
jgi:hypothetical protein